MKNTILLLAIFSIFFLSINLRAEDKWIETKIKTTAQCEMCKQTIEKKINKIKGIKHADLNLEDKFLTVKYNSNKVNTDEIRQAITKLGYDADEMKKNFDAYSKLPSCCKSSCK